MLLDLPIDIKIHIASFDENIWIYLAIRDPEIYKYTIANRLIFVQLFTNCAKCSYSQRWKLLNREHREEFDTIGIPLPSYTDDNVQEWRLSGKLHSINDHPSLIFHNYKTWHTYKIWHIQGKRHRYCIHGKGCNCGDIQPAQIAFDNEVTKSKWYIMNNKHSYNDKPAVIKYNRDSLIVLKWYWYGNLHRDNDQPAIETNNMLEWYQYGLLHRDNDKPAHIVVSESIIYCTFYFHDKIHRDNDKPARIVIKNGTIIVQQWYHHGLKHRSGNLPAVIKEGKNKYYNYGIKIFI